MSRPAHALKQAGPEIGVGGPIELCPGCAGRDLRPQELCSTIAFRCADCDALWRFELGYVWPVHAREGDRKPAH